MSSKAITETEHDKGPKDDRGRLPTANELAPSMMSEDDPTAARFVGLLAAVLVIICGVFLAYNLYYATTPGRFHFPSGWLTIGLVLGLVGLLFHAAYDRDVQFRRLYLIFGGAALVVGVFLSVLPNPNAGDQFKSGFPCMALALIFVLASLRNEDDLQVRNMVQFGLGAVGAAMILFGVVWGSVRGGFLLPYGLLLTLLGLFYVAGFVVSRGVSDDLAYRAGWGLGAVGLAVFVVAFCRSIFPPLFFAWGWWGNDRPHEYLMPYGLLLMLLGFVSVLVSLGLCSENRLVVLTRREMMGFFFSPVAYFVLIGFTLAMWLAFYMWVFNLARREGPIPEPVIGGFILQWPPVVLMMFAIPALTMRLVSEERRSGTLEVLMTTPTEETTVVLSKFLAAFLMFLTMWVPFGLFLVAFRLIGNAPFDYRPLLSFAVALTVTGAGFTSMGLFFSSLTRSQVVSGILAFAFMMVMTFVFIIKLMLENSPNPTPLITNSIAVLEHISFLDLWFNSINGKLAIRQLLFHGSMAAWWLFVTVKVLEARRWL